jgi:hypothetical protein
MDAGGDLTLRRLEVGGWLVGRGPEGEGGSR